MPKYKVLQKCYVDGRILEEGEVVDLNIETKSGPVLEALDEKKSKSKE